MNTGRLAIVIKRVDMGRYQAQLRTSAGGNVLFFGRRETKSDSARKMAESVFGSLIWSDPPEKLKISEPEVSKVAYIDIEVSQ
jgi:hypothetical protein